MFFDRQSKGPVNLIVKNIGKTIAKDTTLRITPELNHPESHPISQTNLLNKPIPDIPPDFQYKAFAGMGWDLKQDDGNYQVYEVEVTYKNSSDDSYKEYYILDLNFESGLLFLEERNINDLAKDFNEYIKINTRQLDSINNSLKKISDTLQADEKR